MTNYILLNNWLMIDDWCTDMNIPRSSHHHQFDPAWEAGGVRDDEGGGGHGEAGPAVPVHRGRGAGVEVTGLPAGGDRQTVQSAVQCQRRTRALFSETKKNDINQTSNIFFLTSLPLQPRSCAAVLFWHLTADLLRRQYSLQSDRDLI